GSRFPCRQLERLKSLVMLDARSDTIEPGALIGAAWRSEGRARQLLGIKTIGRTLRRVHAMRQSTWHAFCLEVVAEARHVSKIIRRNCTWRCAFQWAHLVHDNLPIWHSRRPVI